MTSVTDSSTDWMDDAYSARIPIDLSNSGNRDRTLEPVIVDLTFGDVDVHPNAVRVADDNHREIRSQLFDEEVDGDRLTAASVVFLADVDDVETTYWVYVDDADQGRPDYDGIEQLDTQLEDGVKRLDTDHYELELCRGKADGTAAGKWGIRYFEAKSQGENLIEDCGNAIGGFYGPFFTPGNGKVNPPEHTTVDVTTEVEGPLYARYRFEGTIPDGLDPNLRDKDFEITWEFFAETPWFRRQYDVDEYSTTVDGMPVENKITVGDEFESGQGDVVLSQFGAAGGTHYRAGDRYANILAREVERLLELPDDEVPDGIQTFREAIGDDIMNVSWDYFWRLFCVEEGILDDDEIRDHVSAIVDEAHESVHQTERKDDVRSTDFVDVPDSEDQTVFPMNADKTVERDPETGYAMVWYTSNPVARYQIVQRPASGWVNWGTNGENEYPELPIGSTVLSGYGQFDDWEAEARKMEYPLEYKVRPTQTKRDEN